MKNLKIGKKLIVTFGVIIVLYLLTVVFSLLSLSASESSFEDFYTNGYPVSNTTTDMRRAIQSAMKCIALSMLTDDEQKTESYVTEADKQMQTVSEGFTYMETNFRGDGSIISDAKALMQNATPLRKEILDLAAQNKNDEAMAIFFNEYEPILTQVQDLMREVDKTTSDLADENYTSSSRRQIYTVVLVIGFSIIALAATIFLATYITKGLTLPIKELEAAANEMAQGNLKVHVEYSSKDELGGLSTSIRIMSEKISYYMGEITSTMEQLAMGDLNVKKREPFLGDFQPVQEAIRTLVGSLNNTLSQIDESADQVANGSEQVSSGAQALSQGATEQASSVEELAATITELSQQVKDTAHNAEQAQAQTAKAGDEVISCNGQMKDMINAMADITEKSHEIGKIIKTIEDISFQTNILALNAAVEAARAGSAGKGFAVVADEVRNLANKSSEASKNTSGLIEATIHAVEKGTIIANETAESLMRVVEDAGAVTLAVDKITRATTDQAASITQVTLGVDQISSVVQTNSATAEESAAASEELSGQAQMLKNLTSKFKLKVEASRKAEPAEVQSYSPEERETQSVEILKY